MAKVIKTFIKFYSSVPLEPDFKNVLRIKNYRDFYRMLEVWTGESQIKVLPGSSALESSMLLGFDSYNYKNYNISFNNLVNFKLTIDAKNFFTNISDFNFIQKYNYLEVFTYEIEDTDPEVARIGYNIKRYFYFVRNHTIINENIVNIDCSLDIFSTFGKEIAFNQDIFVERNHRTRFVKKQTYTFVKTFTKNITNAQWTYDDLVEAWTSSTSILTQFGEEIDHIESAEAEVDNENIRINYINHGNKEEVYIGFYSNRNTIRNFKVTLKVTAILTSPAYEGYIYSDDALLGDEIDSNFEARAISKETHIESDSNKLKWLVCFVAGSTSTPAATNYSIKGFFVPIQNFDRITVPYDVYVAPLWKSGTIKVGNNPAYVWDAWELYRKCSTDFSDRFICAKITSVTPISLRNITLNRIGDHVINFVADSNNDISLSHFTSGSQEIALVSPNPQSVSIVENNININNSVPLFEFDTFDKLFDPTFNEKEIDNFLNIPEPKLFTSPYYKTALHCITGEDYFFDIFTLSKTGNFIVKAEGFVTPDSDKTIFYLLPNINEEGYLDYHKFDYSNGIGKIFAPEYTLPANINKYTEYVNQKSNAAITGLVSNIGFATVGTAVGAGIALTAFNPVTALLGVGAGAAAIAAKVISYKNNIDVLKRSPDSIKLSGNTAFYDSLAKIMDSPCNLLEFKLLESEEKIVKSYFLKYGYKINRFMAFENCFTRQIFNYIKVSDEDLKTKLTLEASEKIKDTIIDILSQGVEFWDSQYFGVESLTERQIRIETYFMNISNNFNPEFFNMIPTIGE